MSEIQGGKDHINNLSDEELEALILEMEREGTVTSSRDENGKLVFKLTDRGLVQVETLIQTNPEAAQFYADVQRHAKEEDE